MKTCKTCLELKSMDEFYTHSLTADRKRGSCRDCLRGGGYLRRYGISLKEYNNFMDRQGGVCAVCGCPEKNSRYGRLAVDHNHENGEVRGLLCDSCNNGLGRFGDNPDRLISAAAYLIRSTSSEVTVL